VLRQRPKNNKMSQPVNAALQSRFYDIREAEAHED